MMIPSDSCFSDALKTPIRRWEINCQMLGIYPTNLDFAIKCYGYSATKALDSISKQPQKPWRFLLVRPRFLGRESEYPTKMNM